MFVVGGFDEDSTPHFLKTSEVYDATTMKLTDVAANNDVMWTYNRCFLHVSGDEIFIINENQYCVYDLDNNSWSPANNKHGSQQWFLRQLEQVSSVSDLYGELNVVY